MSATPADCPWILRGRAAARDAIRLLCFPYAGGGAAAVFRTWKDQFAPIAEPLPMELPGRAARHREAPCRRVRDLAVTLAASLEGHQREPLAFVEHSLGALLAFEVVREMRRRGAPPPLHLFVETYEYVAEEPLDCPITAIGGLGDSRVSLEALEAWALETREPFRPHRFSGGHFYFRQADAELTELVRRTLEGDAAAPRAN